MFNFYFLKKKSIFKLNFHYLFNYYLILILENTLAKTDEIFNEIYF